MGRPTKYNPKYCETITKMMGEGYSKQAVAGELGISRDTLYEWSKTYKEFSDTIKKGEMLSLLYWEKIGIDGTLGKIKGFRPAVWIFIMKNRFGWHDNLSITDDVADIPDMSKDDAEADIRDIVREYGDTLRHYSFPVKNVS